MNVSLYCTHPNTAVTIFGFQKVDTDLPFTEQASPVLVVPHKKCSKHVIKERKLFTEHIRLDLPVVAFNAGFDLNVYNHTLEDKYKKVGNRLSEKSIACAMVQAHRLGAGGSLDNTCKFLFKQRKVSDGKRLMKLFAGKKYEENMVAMPEEFELYETYCKRDVLLTTKIALLFYKRYKSLWATDYDKIVESDTLELNGEGIRIDLKLCKFLEELTTHLEEENNKAICKLTNGKVEKITQNKRFLDFIIKKCEYPEASLNKTILAGLTKYKHPLGLKLLEYRKASEINKIKKVRRVLSLVQGDRLRDYISFGTSVTGRYTSRGANLLNMARPNTDREYTVDQVKRLIDLGSAKVVKSIRDSNKVQDLAIDLLRRIVIPDNKKVFLVADYSSVERRIICTLAGQTKSIEKQKNGDDEYNEFASLYFKKEVKKGMEERNVGKICVLGGQYGAGFNIIKNKFNEAKVYLSDKECQRAVDLYRTTNPGIVAMWAAIHRAMKEAAVEERNFVVHTKSGRKLIYYNLLEEAYKHPKWGHMKIITHDTVFGRRILMKHEITSHIVQSTARDLLVYHIAELSKEGHKVILAPHDEVVINISTRKEEKSILKILNKLPKWLDYPHGVDYTLSRTYCK